MPEVQEKPLSDAQRRFKELRELVAANPDKAAQVLLLVVLNQSDTLAQVDEKAVKALNLACEHRHDGINGRALVAFDRQEFGEQLQEDSKHRLKEGDLVSQLLHALKREIAGPTVATANEEAEQ